MRRIALLSLFFLPLFAEAQLDLLINTESPEPPPPTGVVDLLWEGKTYTPPFFLGRPLWSNQSALKIVAIPAISGASSLVYRWTKDGEYLSEVSGAGKRTLELADSVFSRPINIKLEVLNSSATAVLAVNTLYLRPRIPELIVIEDSSLYGPLFNAAVPSVFRLTEDEVSFVAIPLYANIPNRSSTNGTFTWTTNTGDNRTGTRATYRIPEDASGESEVTVRFSNSKTLTQPAPKSFLVQFGKELEI